ncbi:MAG: ABC transporter permease subunit [Pelosinus sp.]|nr:ABC transporter permease subunit [Pelosinus sp.]
MLQYVSKRILSLVLVLYIVITATFLLMHAIPGGPFTAEKKLAPEVLRNINARYHLDDPLWQQYTDYMGNILKFDFGPSFKYQDRTVNKIIADGFPVSLQLGSLAVLLAVAFGIPAGIIAALRHNRFLDYLVMSSSTLGISIPSFILASLLIYFLAFKIKLFPAAMWNGFSYMILPSISLAALPMAVIARLMRSSMLEVLSQDFIRTARAKGVGQGLLIYRHALKNSLIPVVTYVGPMAAGVLTGSFVVESIFNIPGLGRHFVTSIYNRDYTVILGITIFYSALIVFFNFLVDIAYVLLDPRISLDKKGEN